MLITKLRTANTAETQQYRKASKALLVLIPLLGITYLVILTGPEDIVNNYLYAILRAFLISTQVWQTTHQEISFIWCESLMVILLLQGFSVSLLYCFFNSEVKQTIRHRVSNWQEERNIGTDSHSDHRKQRHALSRDSRSRTESIR